MTGLLRRRGVLGGGAVLAGALAAPARLRAQGRPRLRFGLDWARQGSNAYVALAEAHGSFRDASVDATVDRGFGSGRVPVDVAAGSYDLAQADINPAIKFMAERPDAGLVIVGIWADRSGLCVTVPASSPVRVPRDLEGRTLAAPESDAGRQFFPAFARAAGIAADRVRWLTVSPELREPMLVRGRADGITGLVTSTSLSLKALGMGTDQQRIMYYRDHGLDLLGGCYVTTRAVLERNPDGVRAALAALFRALVHTNANRGESIAVLRRMEPLTGPAIEGERQDLSFDQQILSDHVRAHGLSSPDPARFQRAVTAVEEAYGIAGQLRIETIYTDTYLPSRSLRQI